MTQPSLFFAMVPDADGIDQPAFFLRKKQAPKGAHAITAQRHAQLVEALADGKTVTAKPDGSPQIQSLRVNADARRAELAARIRREAARRIEQISPVWRQLNDQRDPSAAGNRRFAQIDAVRIASNAITDSLDDVAAARLSDFPVSTNALWPEVSE